MRTWAVSTIKPLLQMLEQKVPTRPVFDFLITQAWVMLQVQRILNPFNPRTFADLTFRINLFQRTHLRAQTANKATMKAWVETKVGPQYVIPTVAIIENTHQIDLEEWAANLPLIAKPAHGSGDVYWLNAEEDITSYEFAHFVRRCMNHHYDREGRQGIYRMMPAGIIVEKTLQNQGRPLDDFKFHCIHGQPVLIQHDTGRGEAHHQTFYTPDWHRLDVQAFQFLKCTTSPQPPQLNEMREVASTLAGDFDYVRVDLYASPDGVFVGELTHIPWSSRGDFVPRAFSRHLVDVWRRRMSVPELSELYVCHGDANETEGDVSA